MSGLRIETLAELALLREQEAFLLSIHAGLAPGSDRELAASDAIAEVMGQIAVREIFLDEVLSPCPIHPHYQQQALAEEVELSRMADEGCPNGD